MPLTTWKARALCQRKGEVWEKQGSVSVIKWGFMRECTAKSLKKRILSSPRIRKWKPDDGEDDCDV